MHTQQYIFEKDEISVLLDANFSSITKFAVHDKIVILTDETIQKLYKKTFAPFKTVTVKATEKNKTQATVDEVIEQLLALDIDKSYLLVAVGGGVVTDMGGYIASIYKRGIALGLVPTTILAMTDAAIGGKNGVNVGIYKNMVGTIYRPKFILYDYTFLQTLPITEWINGFAEIIKHACIKDAAMFDTLATHNIDFYIENKAEAAKLIEQNVQIKFDVVLADEHEKADRYLLNFGHTFGHAIENLYQLPHGHAISIGMVLAAKLSIELSNFSITSATSLQELLQQYKLPTQCSFDKEKILKIILQDKKRVNNSVHFVLLKKIGQAETQQITFDILQSLID